LPILVSAQVYRERPGEFAGATEEVESMRRRRNRHSNRTIAITVGSAVVAGVGVAVAVAASSGGSPKALHPDAVSSSLGVASSAVNGTCEIVVPAHPLTARGLATPYQLTGPNGETPAASGCQMINSINLGAFVQATILNPKTGALSVYNPLVITQGTTPAVRPVVPKLPPHAVVTIDIGFNGTTLLQAGATPEALAEGNCTDGMPGSPFGQVSFCNGSNFFKAALGMMHTNRMDVPAAGTTHAMIASGGSIGTGRECPTTRNFDMVDQDPSDNVTAKYILNPATGQTAQDNAANAAMMKGDPVLVNGSDNALIDNFLDPAFGCSPFMAPDLGNHGAMSTSQALDELLAAANQPADPALVPESDGMVTDLGGGLDAAKTDLYRSEIGQAPVDSQTDASSSPQMFCQNLVNIQTPFLAANEKVLAAYASPIPTVGDTLYTFLASRLASSFDNLNCANFGLTNPVQLVNNGAGAATEATLNTAQQVAGF
jgi:hypothetical protein